VNNTNYYNYRSRKVGKKSHSLFQNTWNKS